MEEISRKILSFFAIVFTSVLFRTYSSNVSEMFFFIMTHLYIILWIQGFVIITLSLAKWFLTFPKKALSLSSRTINLRRQPDVGVTRIARNVRNHPSKRHTATSVTPQKTHFHSPNPKDTLPHLPPPKDTLPHPPPQKTHCHIPQALNAQKHSFEEVKYLNLHNLLRYHKLH